MKRHLLFGVVPLLLAIPLWGMALKRKSNPVFLLSHYPHPPLLDLRDHTDAIGLQRQPGRTDAPVLVTTWFPRNTPYHVPMGCAQLSSVDEQGYVTTWRNACGDTQRQVTQQLSPAQMKQLTQEGRSLPSNDLPSDENDLVMLTFCDGTCQTRLYNRTQLPAQVKNLYGITGASLNTDK